LLTLGEFSYPNPAKGAPDRMPVSAYLVRTSKGKNILIDTGAPASTNTAMKCEERVPPGELFVKPGDDVADQLGRLGLQPRDIDLLVTTHFDWEHCGRHDLFAAAGTPVLVQGAHYDYAINHPERYDRSLFDFEGWNYQFVEGDVEIERGLILLETSGEATGHQSVYVNTVNGPVLLTVDAIPWPSIAQTREFPDWTENPVQANESIDKLMEFALDTRAFTIFGHDAVQWGALPHAPRAFSR
jgi:N-acyl homoserine lactone hydrolase